VGRYTASVEYQLINKCMKSESIEVKSTDFWFKIVEFLQQNWALIELGYSADSCTIFFLNDDSGVFDRIQLDSVSEAKQSLQRNGFSKYSEATKAKEFISPPNAPYHISKHPNGKIYSLVKYWV
jgi:hypothetical protein